MIEKFNNHFVFISENAFKQNNLIKKEIRLDVSYCLTLKNILCIGGESYLFGLTNDNIINITHYTNSKYIYDDAIKNNNILKKKLKNNIINYNTFTNIISADILLINIAKLNINLLNNINKRFYKKIIIINCHHIEFWKRIKILSNYKLISRKQYISKLYFVTVNILEYKFNFPTFISLGTTCAVAYQLNNLGLRNNSFPFDWSKLNIKQLNLVLENNFSLYDDIKIKKFSYNHSHKCNKDIGSYILKNKYNIEFAHELINNDINDLNNLNIKIINRITRFYENKENYNYFIILNLNKNKDKDLNKLLYNLDKIFISYKLLYISNNNPNIINNKLKWICIDNNYIDWQYSNLNWFDIIYNNI